jgi:hypothetical protein
MTKQEWIKSQILKDETPSATASRLNTPIEIDNPTPNTPIPKPYTRDELLILIPTAELIKIDISMIDYIGKVINDRVALGAYVLPKLVSQNIFSKNTVANLQELLTATVENPDYKPKIWMTPAEIAGFDAVLTDEVEAAANT